jgi:hypothetical protein
LQPRSLITRVGLLWMLLRSKVRVSIKVFFKLLLLSMTAGFPVVASISRLSSPLRFV